MATKALKVRPARANKPQIRASQGDGLDSEASRRPPDDPTQPVCVYARTHPRSQWAGQHETLEEKHEKSCTQANAGARKRYTKRARLGGGTAREGARGPAPQQGTPHQKGLRNTAHGSLTGVHRKKQTRAAPPPEGNERSTQAAGGKEENMEGGVGGAPGRSSSGSRR